MTSLVHCRADIASRATSLCVLSLTTASGHDALYVCACPSFFTPSGKFYASLDHCSSIRCSDRIVSNPSEVPDRQYQQNQLQNVRLVRCSYCPSRPQPGPQWHESLPSAVEQRCHQPEPDPGRAEQHPGRSAAPGPVIPDVAGDPRYRLGREVHRCWRCHRRCRWIWCRYRNSIRFSDHRLRKKPIPEAAAVLLRHSGIRPVRGHGSVLFDDGLLAALRFLSTYFLLLK